MKIRYEFDENDFLNFQSYFRGLERLVWVMLECIVIISSLLLGGITYWITGDKTWAVFIPMMTWIMANLILIGVLWLLAVSKLKIARKQAVFGEIVFTFSDQGFHLYHHQLAQQDESYQGHFQHWSVVKKMKESRDYFFLSLGLGKDLIIPKRAFPSRSEIDGFRQNVGSWIRLSQSKEA